MSKYLSFYGGDRAISIIKEHGGLTQDIVKVVAGAAGGPKWLILGAMDRFLFSEFFAKRLEPLFLIGSSAGAWRFAAASHNDPAKALEKFFDSYIHQWYSIKPTLDEIDVECKKVLDKFLDDSSVNQILNHLYCRINFFSVRSKLDFTNQNPISPNQDPISSNQNPISSNQNSISSNKSSVLNSINDNPIVLVSYIMAAAIANLFNRRNMRHFFTRTLFHHPSKKPPFYDMDKVSGKDNFPMLKVPLTSGNFKKALLSSGSIPLVMPCIKDIPQAPKGVYRDGGTIDYHLDIPFLSENSDKIVLFPHYTDRIVPGWLDKHITWRKPDPDNFRNVLLITPTKKFTDMLPGGKIPERQDFQTFKGKNRERIQRWKIALKYSEILGDELCRVFYSQTIDQSIQPIERIIKSKLSY
ncbi:MAG: hypothetical protein HQK63_02185 [Desulfamplus sp.]|nr:hypothetical protein [Desulfamplus sp.]